LNAIAEIFTGIDQEVLLSVFESWIYRAKWVIKHEEKYCTKQRKKKIHFSKIDREPRRIRTHGPL
jgi:hypothetical protein